MEPFSPSSRSHASTTVTGSYSEYDTNTTVTESHYESDSNTTVTSYSEYDHNRTIIEQKISRFLEATKVKDPILSDFIEYLRKINDNNDIKAIFGLLYAPIAMELEEPPSIRSEIQTLENPAKSLLKKFLDSKFKELKEKHEELSKLKDDFYKLIRSFEKHRKDLEIQKTNTDKKAAIELFEKRITDKELNLADQEEKLIEESETYSFTTSTDITAIDENTTEGRSYIMDIYLNFIQKSGLLDVKSTSHHSDFIITHLNNLIKYQSTLDFSKLKKISYFDDEGNNKKIIISTDLTKDKEYLGEPNTVTIGLSPWVIREEKTSIDSECDRYEIFYYTDGSKYDWEWSEGKRNEKGAEYHFNGSKYYGYWINGKKHGEGTEYYPPGSKYHGKWENDKKHGEGTFYYPSGSKKYEGQWENNQPNGEGTFYYPDGSILYKGQWNGGNRHGEGTSYYPNGLIQYKGQWKGNQANGEGTFYYPDGSRYEGEWSDGSQNGQGTLYNPDGSIQYKGQWNGGNRHGEGIRECSNGDIVKEKWENDEMIHDEIIQSTKLDPANPDNETKPKSASPLGESIERNTGDKPAEHGI